VGKSHQGGRHPRRLNKKNWVWLGQAGWNRGQLWLSSITLRLVPGMLVNAEIHLGTRSVLEYLLSPVQKVAHEAGRER